MAATSSRLNVAGYKNKNEIAEITQITSFTAGTPLCLPRLQAIITMIQKVNN
jgi:hypothetical protein